MLKIIITTLLITTSAQLFGSEYLVKVSNTKAGDSIVLTVSSDNELNLLLNEINSSDDLIINSIKSDIQFSDAIKRGGGEGGID